MKKRTIHLLLLALSGCNPTITPDRFVDHPTDYQDKIVTIAPVYLDGQGSSARLPQRMQHDVRFDYHGIWFAAYLPGGTEVPNAGPNNEALAVTIKCEQGRVDKGNLVGKIERAR